MESHRQSYASVFDGILKEDEELSKLYESLKCRLLAEEGALNKGEEHYLKPQRALSTRHGKRGLGSATAWNNSFCSRICGERPCGRMSSESWCERD